MSRVLGSSEEVVPASTSGHRTAKKIALLSERRTAVYRFFGSDGGLLYVGITCRLHKRWQEHARDYASTWWPLVKSNTVQWFEQREDAELAEREAIRTEDPAYNVLLTERHRVPRGQRLSRQVVSVDRGEDLLPLLRQHFGARPFTIPDAIAVTNTSPSGTRKNITALTSRGRLVIVGARHTVNDREPYRVDSALYMLPIHQWVAEREEVCLPPTALMERKELEMRLPRLPRQRVSVPQKRPAQQRPTTRKVHSDGPVRETGPVLPLAVTFSSGARLLVQLGIVTSMTRSGVYGISKKHPDWPFGEGKPHKYGLSGKAIMMDTQVFVAWFKDHPPVGRGPGKANSKAGVAGVTA